MIHYFMILEHSQFKWNTHTHILFCKRPDQTKKKTNEVQSQLKRLQVSSMIASAEEEFSKAVVMHSKRNGQEEHSNEIV